MGEHLVFFDEACALCRRSIQHIIEIDTKKHFLFAPLNGETAADILSGPQQALKKSNSLILVENYQSTERRFWIRSKALSRIYWLNEDGWGLLGIAFFLPDFITDPIYRWVSAHRHQFKLKISELTGPKDRFLP